MSPRCEMRWRIMFVAGSKAGRMGVVFMCARGMVV